jgi:hypothetical protein
MKEKLKDKMIKQWAIQRTREIFIRIDRKRKPPPPKKNPTTNKKKKQKQRAKRIDSNIPASSGYGVNISELMLELLSSTAIFLIDINYSSNDALLLC